ncbi:MAG TPA: 4-alpha-glucanotransferase [Thermoanaerobaculia bacterium]|nr:4-alpha-glucanotransferase [Thermoanaerobaculia bacterium]
MRTSALRELARQYSIETSYTDAAGKRRQASKRALMAAIDARKRVAKAIHDPVRVVWGNQRLAVDGEWDLELEDGSWRSGRGPQSLDPLPHGYHSLRTKDGGETLIIAAPMRCYAPRKKQWGIFAPLYAAHTRRSWGTGDLGDLLQYASWVDHHGGSVVATLPMLAAFDDDPSPYSPHSRLFWNELYLDVTRLPEFRNEDADLGAVAHLQQLPSVDHEAVRREKKRVLGLCAARFVADAEFEKFASGEAREYAQFRGDEPYHLYVQYRLAQQMREVANSARRLGAGLYLDFPLGVNPGGYDAHRYTHVFANGVSAGAPPDLFFTKGQNWGFAPFDPDALRADRYAYFRKAIRQHVAHAGILRIDHVMGLHRLFWIPDGLDPADGVYVRYNAEELYAILTLESRRHACTVVGEDLGTVPPEVPKTMSRHGLRRMYVAQYEMQPDQPLPAPPEASVASINTHDMPPFAAWWKGQDIDDRLQQGLLDEVSAHREHDAREKMRRGIAFDSGSPDAPHAIEALLMFLAESDAEIVLINLEDLWGETEPQNMPGVPGRSWRHKLRLGLEAARADGSIRRVLTNMNDRRASPLQQQSETKEG